MNSTLDFSLPVATSPDLPSSPPKLTSRSSRFYGRTVHFFRSGSAASLLCATLIAVAAISILAIAAILAVQSCLLLMTGFGAIVTGAATTMILFTSAGKALISIPIGYLGCGIGEIALNFYSKSKEQYRQE